MPNSPSTPKGQIIRSDVLPPTPNAPMRPTNRVLFIYDVPPMPPLNLNQA